MPEMTIKELAKICGVAVSTVSRAMNDRGDVNPSTRARIRAAAAKYGYVPNTSARRLKIGSTETISVFVQGELAQLLVEVLQGLEEAFAEAGYEITISHVAGRRKLDHAATVERIVREGKFAGVVFLGRYGNADREESAQLSRRLAELDVPMVFCTTTDYSGDAARHSFVSVDDRAGARELTAHLISRGHRRIGFIGAATERDPDHAWALRLEGYAAGLQAAGIAFDDALVVPSLMQSQIYTMRNGYEAMARWLAESPVPVSAFIGVSDAVAIGASRALREAGFSLPADVSIVGFDGLDIAEYHSPSLTTLAQPLAEIAQSTARVLLSTMRDPNRAIEQVWIRGRLRHGDSVRELDLTFAQDGAA